MQLSTPDLRAVPMFPLPNVVLLPGTLLPLHIFEQRYRDMTRDAIAGSKLLVMARLEPDKEPDDMGRPAIFPTIGVGRIVASNELDDGRYNILVRGLLRARIADEPLSPHLYRIVEVEPIDDSRRDGEEILSAARQKLIGLCDELADAMDGSGDKLRELVRSASQPGECADLVSSALVTDPDDRQSLLEMSSPLDRLESTMRHVATVLTRLGATSNLRN